MWDAFGFEFVNFYFIPGLVLGCIYALGAIGITLTFGILRFANFAHGEIMMSGAYLTWTVMAIAGGAGLALHPLVALVPAAFMVILLASTTPPPPYRCAVLLAKEQPIIVMSPECTNTPPPSQFSEAPLARDPTS